MCPVAWLACLVALAGCAIAPPPPEGDPIEAALREEGQWPLPDPVQMAACVSQSVPGSVVQLRRSGAAVRPAPGTAGVSGRPDFAVILEKQSGGAVAWRRLVADADPRGGATAQALDRALLDCAALLGRTA